jgi:hypothetical protein
LSDLKFWSRDNSEVSMLRNNLEKSNSTLVTARVLCWYGCNWAFSLLDPTIQSLTEEVRVVYCVWKD